MTKMFTGEYSTYRSRMIARMIEARLARQQCRVEDEARLRAELPSAPRPVTGRMRRRARNAM